MVKGCGKLFSEKSEVNQRIIVLKCGKYKLCPECSNKEINVVSPEAKLTKEEYLLEQWRDEVYKNLTLSDDKRR